MVVVERLGLFWRMEVGRDEVLLLRLQVLFFNSIRVDPINNGVPRLKPIQGVVEIYAFSPLMNFWNWDYFECLLSSRVNNTRSEHRFSC